MEPQKRPYAPPANVRSILERARSRNLPEVIDSDFLRLSGVSENLFSRSIDALRFLGLIDEAGRPTDTLLALSAAPDEEYRAILAGAVREAYETDFARIDPAKDTQAQIVDAFRPYQPRSQHKRMVMLFLGLCREAGIPVKEAPRDRQMSGKKVARKPSSSRTSSKTPRQGSVVRPHAATPSPSTEMLLGVTVEDIEHMNEADFNEVWAALGKVARARAKAKAASAGRDETEKDGDTDEN